MALQSRDCLKAIATENEHENDVHKCNDNLSKYIRERIELGKEINKVVDNHECKECL